ncbi:MAG TPA: HAMP domain-containing histidine kinase [Sulfurospirillum arcachonense]|nr:HAMP domain-containing histidine kinase [Sulfurospirillum arcachonense]HIP44879.1 HAMP domain-containing histidine kinase [Sulfurospirillum arcachonense]
MTRNSLSNKVTLVFVFSILLLVMFFEVLFKYQGEKDLEAMKERQLQSINYIFILYRNNLSPHGINEYFSNFGLKRVKNQNLRTSVLEKGVVVFQKNSDLGKFSSIRYNDRYYLYIDNMISNVLLESKYKKRANDFLWIGFVIAFIILISMYISILRSIAPLKELSSQIRKFSLGDMDIDCKSNKQDEIAEVANEFDRAASKLRDLIHSRQLFLRTIMHELKTPIGKGRIVAEMIHDEKAKKRLISIFERLDLLINEFSKIEQIVSKNYSLQLQSYNLVDIVDSATDMLMLDDDKKSLHVKVDIDPSIVIKADFESFALAVKNLLDNAIKYADDRVAHVYVIDSALYIENRAKKFPMAIEEYYKPFVSGSREIRKGLGLGLYIVKNIVKLNDFELNYEYIDGMHRFSVEIT